MPDLKLLGLPYSPWTERARWALDHHRVPYEFAFYMPILGEPLLRLRLGKLGHATVPVLFRNGKPPITDSVDIAKAAGSLAVEGANVASLFPPEREAGIDEWLTELEVMLAASRNIVGTKTVTNDEVLAAEAPKWIPGPMRAFAARSVMKLFLAKYGLPDRDATNDQAIMRTFLIRTTSRVSALPKEKPYLLGEFSFADISLATGLQMILPVRHERVRMRSQLRNAWTQTELIPLCEPLLAWRDELYRKHRDAAVDASSGA